jgi:hypothetical protein
VSVADGTSVIPPGWYPDPADAARLRRWDGQQWTQEVLLAPEQAPAEASVPTAPPAAPEPYSPPPAEPAPQPAAEAAPPAAPQAPPPTAAGQPPAGQPVPPSPAPSSAPPGAPPMQAAPAAGQAPMPPTVPRPSPPVNQHPNPSSGPVSLPEWANLPGLTLPPDLSSLPGMEPNSILRPPTFAEPEPQLGLPTLPVFEPPFIPQRPDVQDVGRAPSAPTKQRPDAPPPAAPYAPPPSGAQYDVPPPPGMAHVPAAGPVLPPSAFVAPQMPPTAWPTLPPVGSVPMAPAASADFGTLPRTVPDRSFESAAGSATVSSWLIGVLPLVQFAVVYVVFGVLAITLAPGMQWGILAAPAALSLLFANADRKKLTDLGFSAPSIVFAFIPPLYLLVRCFTTGRSSVLPLIAWIVLQAGAAAGVYYLLPSVLDAAIRAIG